MKKVVRVIGALVSVAAGALMASGVISITRVGSCGRLAEQVCPSGVGTDIFKLAGGSVLIAVGAIMTMGQGVLLACLAAGVTVIIMGNGTPAKILGAAMIAFAGLIMLSIFGSRRTRITRSLNQAGFKERAVKVRGVVTAVKDTGMTINDNPRVAITAEYLRADGSSVQFEHKMVVSRISVPQPGAPVTVWYDPARAEKELMEIGSPDPVSLLTGSDQFGADLTDPVLGGGSFGAYAPRGPEDAVPGSAAAEPLIAGLERLSALHRDGALTDAEYAQAKQRLLERG